MYSRGLSSTSPNSGIDMEAPNIQSVAYNKDCMEIMHGFPDKYFDLAIVDPPYGLKKSSKSGSGKLKDRYINIHSSDFMTWDKAPGQDYFNELFRVSKNQVIFGGNYFPLPPCRCFVVWDKKQAWPNFSQAEYAWTSFDKPSKIYRLSGTWRSQNPVDRKIHPTQKPIPLYDWILDTFAQAGWTILDTHLGSGSSRISAMKHGCPFVGCEISSEYFNSQQERFAEFYRKHINQLQIEL